MGATCSYILVESGDSCGSLAAKCGVSAADFTSYNPGDNFCSTLQPRQPVCCSAGSLPDLSPQPNSDGTCYNYTVQSGDYCAAMASQYYLTVDEIEQYNNQTWGWTGCSGLQPGETMCLSTGTPPMPAVSASAECGPQVSGTARPADWSTIGSLNPCPLNACCSQWGSCGTSADYCAATASSTGAPGTSGCVSNCGTAITNNNDAPAQYFKIGYYEGWNEGRSCLTMSVDQIPTGYTHIHYAFGDIASDFSISMTSTELTQFEEFAKQTSYKRILSVGGGAFSTDASTATIFRSGVTAANRQTFATNVASWVQQYSLDGVDFDWEYPASTAEGADYLAFLQTLRSLLPSGTTISMATPPSYYYLKNFPIAEMSNVLDYIVYMTYDLHGQWDYGSSSIDGCPGGGCLRSHVNITETVTSLALITKAGVPSTKIVVGIANYGRSFGMVDPSCTDVTCHFTGPASTAMPGKCTETAGYLAEAEILQAISTNATGTASWHDDASNSDIVTLADGTWVAYMNEDTKSFRRLAYQILNFGGYVEWAVDLAAFVDNTQAPLALFASQAPTTSSIATTTPTTTTAVASTFSTSIIASSTLVNETLF